MSESHPSDSTGAGGAGAPNAHDLQLALSQRLAAYSVRGLADKSHWGRTVVSDIKSGRQLPTSKQLQDLLRAVGADDDELAEWEERRQLASANRTLEPVLVGTAPVPGSEASPARLRFPWRRMLLIAGLAVMAVVLVLAAVEVNRLVTPSQPTAAPRAQSPSNSSPSAVSPTPTPTPGAAAEISSPPDGARVSSSKGVRLSGTVHTEGAQTVWLIDQDSDGTYTADTTVDRSSDGTWAAEDAPIGDPSDIPSRITIVLVSADDRCAAFLRKEVEADDSTFESLPRGCEVLDTVSVAVDRR